MSESLESVGELSSYLSNLLDICVTGKVTNEIYDKILSLLRDLRLDCCNTSYQNVIRDFKNALIIINLGKLLSYLIDIQYINQKAETCITVGLQCMGNFVVNNEQNQKFMITEQLDFYRNIFPSVCLKQRNIICMIYYNVYMGHADFENNIIEDDQFIVYVGEHFDSSDCDFAFLFLEYFIRHTRHFKVFYDILPVDLRLKVLRFIDDGIQTDEIVGDENCKISRNVVDFLVKTLSSYDFESILEYVYCSNIPRSWEITLMISILSSVSKITTVLEVLSETGFCHYIVELFIKIHNDEQHLMAMRSKILKEDITEYPSFAFKRNIIRIIANISWTDKFLKKHYPDLLRILSECNRFIDENNPFATEWAVFAIKNISEVTET